MDEWETQCPSCLNYVSILGFRIDGPDHPEHLLEACVSCKVIRAYNMDNHQGTTVFTKIKPAKLCAGPNDTLLIWDSSINTIIQLACKDRKFDPIRTTGPLEFNLLGMLYNEYHDFLILTFITNCYTTKTVAAMKLGGDSFLWERPLVQLRPQALCSMSIRRFCLADENNLYIYDASNGKLVENLKTTKRICDVVSSNNGGSCKIAVRQRDHCDQITCYNVTFERGDFELTIPPMRQAFYSQTESELFLTEN